MERCRRRGEDYQKGRDGEKQKERGRKIKRSRRRDGEKQKER